MTTFPPKEIRASMLDGANDCESRAVARQWPRMIADACGALRETPRHIGLAMGTAFHEIMDRALKLRMESQEPIAFKRSILEPGIESLERQSKETEIKGDAITPDLFAGRNQLYQMVERYVPYINGLPLPIAVERQFSMPLRPGYILTGKVDWIDANHFVRDHKSGREARPCPAQTAQYSRLAEHDGGIPVEGLAQDYVARTNKVQPAPVPFVYDLYESQRLHYQVVNDLADRVDRFERTGDPYIFRKNPQSNFCGRKWCPAWKTGMCGVGREEKGETF